MKYFEEQQKMRYSRRINEYAAKVQKLEREKYLLQKRITDLEREIKLLKAQKSF